MAWEHLTDIDKAWIAGIFEGEGTIVNHCKKYIRISIYNNDISMLNEIKRLLGDKVYIHIHPTKRKDSWAPSHQLQMQENGIICNFLKEITPFVRSEAKRNQIERVVSTALENGGAYYRVG
jgi:hypothetical protein